MTMFRRSLTMALLSVASVGCLADPPTISRPEERPGHFIITIQAFNNGPSSGPASFQIQANSETESFSLSFADTRGIAIEISGPDVPDAGSDFPIGEAEGDFRGTVRRRTAGGTEIYSLTSGSLSVSSSSKNQVSGGVEFTAVQVEGPAVGMEISGKGTFTATGGNVEM